MGLIKTGIQLAGAYGLLRAGSKAANEFQDKKQSNQNQNHHCNCHHHHEQYQQPPYQQPQFQQPYQQPQYQQQYQQPQYHQQYQQYQQPQPGYDPRMNPNAGPQSTPIHNEGSGQLQQNDQRFYSSNGR
ncbi:hypothetical protein BO78DRAFT_84019 [Aspergillus sclerotiicarbonarius CBS 121057]|uniref:Uncharacterized protein n=1 Tax=Aspergillus sclerotiicarbonarius (strain CBS 121057 / IBT 28362) TaxID=1448318 RepID=A0A319EC38_ASPSB|nr:hypothetical protein BO78DRAFT_84019 [Aspergillus sclerotiicarbonarius CBS 121057]